MREDGRFEKSGNASLLTCLEGSGATSYGVFMASPTGFAGLSEMEKQYFAVCLLDGEICNGGYDQFFFDHAGSHYNYALLGLKDMGADQTLALLLQAKQVLFAFNEVPEETGRRRAAMRMNLSDSQTVLLEQLASLHWKDPDDLKLRCEAFARRHKLI